MSQSKNEPRQSDLAVMEANEYKQKRRLERILDAQDDVEDIAKNAYANYAEGQISNSGKNILLLEAVQNFIREIHNLLMDYTAGLGEEEPNIYWVGREDSPLGRIEFQSKDDLVFFGLRDVLHAERMYVESWEEPVTTRHGPNQTVHRQQQYTVPEKVSWNAFILARMFLSKQHDLEVRFENLDSKRPFSDWRDNS